MMKRKVQTNGISKDNNPAVFEYIKKLNDKGEISAVLMKLIIDSFWGIELPVISRAKVARITATDYSADDVYEAIGSEDNNGLFVSVAALKALVDLKKPDIDPVVIKEYHTAIVRLFL
jgi:hypothetical protein